MKNIKLLLGLASLFVALVWFACKKEDVPQNSSLDLGAVVKASFVGQVVDENDQPVADAAARIGGVSVKTDKNGVFILQNQDVHSRRAIVQVFKAGFWQGSKTLFVAKNSTNNLKIRLLKKETIGSVTGSTGGKVSGPHGLELDFPSGSVAKNGAVFNGKINVQARLIDPTSSTIYEEMPGDLRGFDANGNESVLTSFGMVWVELTDASGNELQVLTGKTVKMTAEIPSALLSKAEATVPMWHFNETEGLWEREGEAQKVGNSFVAEVAHFSCWNYDGSRPSIVVHGRVVDAAGNPVPANVQICATDNGWACGHGFTNSDGTFIGAVTKGAILQMTIFAYTFDCNGQNFVYLEKTIGPFDVDTDLGDIVVTSSSIVTNYTIHGKLTDCGGNGVSNGYLKYRLGASNYSQIIFPAADGTFSFLQNYCDANPPSGPLTYIGYDLGNQKEGIQQTLAFADDMDLGMLQICNAYSEWIQFTLDGTSYFIAPDANGGFDGPTYGQLSGTLVDPNNPNQTDYFNMNWMGSATVGTYPVDGISFKNIWAQDSLPINNVQVDLQLNQVGAVGQPMIGTFGGTFLDWQGGNHTISGDYKVNRDH